MEGDEVHSTWEFLKKIIVYSEQIQIHFVDASFSTIEFNYKSSLKVLMVRRDRDYLKDRLYIHTNYVCC